LTDFEHRRSQRTFLHKQAEPDYARKIMVWMDQGSEALAIAHPDLAKNQNLCPKACHQLGKLESVMLRIKQIEK